MNNWTIGSRVRPVALAIAAGLAVSLAAAQGQPPVSDVGTPAVAPPAAAQDAPPAIGAAPAPVFTSEQIDSLLSPIALYPDPLVAQILPASTYPLEIVMAARWVAANPDPAVIDQQDWDPSVRAVAHLPSVLNMMDQNLEWTTQLGQAFLNQQQDVMNSIQRLRAQAQTVGTLQSTPQQQVVTQDQAIQILPAQADVVYVPVYDPVIAYTSPYVETFGWPCAYGWWLDLGCDWFGGRVYYHHWFHGGGNWHDGHDGHGNGHWSGHERFVDGAAWQRDARRERPAAVHATAVGSGHGFGAGRGVHVASPGAFRGPGSVGTPVTMGRPSAVGTPAATTLGRPSGQAGPGGHDAWRPSAPAASPGGTPRGPVMSPGAPASTPLHRSASVGTPSGTASIMSVERSANVGTASAAGGGANPGPFISMPPAARSAGVARVEGSNVGTAGAVSVPARAGTFSVGPSFVGVPHASYVGTPAVSTPHVSAPVSMPTYSGPGVSSVGSGSHVSMPAPSSRGSSGGSAAPMHGGAGGAGGGGGGMRGGGGHR